MAGIHHVTQRVRLFGDSQGFEPGAANGHERIVAAVDGEDDAHAFAVAQRARPPVLPSGFCFTCALVRKAGSRSSNRRRSPSAASPAFASSLACTASTN